MVLKGNVIEHSEEEIEEIEGNLEFTLSSCYIVHLNALLYPTNLYYSAFFFFFLANDRLLIACNSVKTKLCT